ncbi:MAG: ATP-binding protein, partial [Planctomycetes bacterium]|nr:ATP-binding protein [Planctomycetota bacterium]
APDAYARELSGRCRKGLIDSGQTPDRIRRLHESAEWRVYTPGSEAGLPLSVLQTFTAPAGKVSREALNQKIDATTTALLGLTGIAADPVQSREHILIAQLLLHAWTAGRDLDLQQLITQIQEPPLSKIGAFDVDTFYPEKERLKLAVALNNILAAPSFSTWITGEALDLGRMLYAGNKPRQLIFYVAHLEDSQRLFFLTLLLEEVLSWTRRQPGTTSLRAILYFDEVFGYLPPHPANPPTKGPLMTLLKQARAYGVGILLATQNPVDLDYKALSNAGTWFVGKLQTERDKARLLEGLEGVAAERGTLSNRAYLETVISALGNRVFLLHDVHRGKPILFQSRWALSFLRGPLTRDQIADLMDPLKKDLAEEPDQKALSSSPAVPPEEEAPRAILLCRRCRAELTPGKEEACPACGEPLPHFPAHAPEQEFKQGLRRASSTPVEPASQAAFEEVAAGVAQFYLPLSSPVVQKEEGITIDLVYVPRLLGFAEVLFADRRKNLEHRRLYHLLAEVPPTGQAVNWAAAEVIGANLGSTPEARARRKEVPEELNAPRKLKALERVFVSYLYGNARLALFTNRTLNLVSTPGEDLAAFRARCRATARAEAARAVAVEKPKYSARFEALHSRLPESPQEHPIHDSDRQGSSWFHFSWLSFLAGTPESPPEAQARPLSSKDQAKVKKLEAEWRGKVQALYEKWLAVGEEYAEVLLAPRKTDIQVTHFGLAWAPFRQISHANGEVVELTPAYERGQSPRTGDPVSASAAVTPGSPAKT